MSYAIRNDGAGWRAVNDASECTADEHFSEQAPQVTTNPRVFEIKSALAEIDQRKIRATTDAILSGDKSRLQALETQAQALRTELAGIAGN